MNEEQKRAYDQFCKVDFSSLIEWYFSLSPYEVAVAAGGIGLLITAPLNFAQQEAVANLLNMIGHTILIVCTHQRAQVELKGVKHPLSHEDVEFLYGPQPRYSPPPNQEIEMLKAQVRYLNEQINLLKK